MASEIDELFVDGGTVSAFGGAVESALTTVTGGMSDGWKLVGLVVIVLILLFVFWPMPTTDIDMQTSIVNPDQSVVNPGTQTTTPPRVPRASARVLGFSGGGNGSYNTITFTAPVNKDLRPPVGTSVYIDLDAQGVFDEKDPKLGDVVTLANSTALNSDGQLIKLRVSGSSTAHRDLGLQEGSVIYWL